MERISSKQTLISLIAAALAIFCSPSSSQTTESPRIEYIDSGLLVDILQEASKYTLLGLPLTVEVGKEKVVSREVLVSKEIRFSDEGTLIISTKGTFAQSKLNYFLIVAETIITQGSDNKIIWDKGYYSDVWGNIEPPPRGDAMAGHEGRSPGESGGPGANGTTGIRGFPGSDGPTLVIIASKIEGPGLKVFIRGTDGVKGGKGENGGRGGNGGPGLLRMVSSINPLAETDTNVSTEQPICRLIVPPGVGGAGGNAGDGGSGGRGGNGGSLLMLSTANNREQLSAFFRFDVSSGHPGTGGGEGTVGNGGDGGTAILTNKDGGDCNGVNLPRGTNGPQGSKGNAGKEGPKGRVGEVLISIMTDEQMKNLLEPQTFRNK